MADTKCPACGGPASQPLLEIYCLTGCSAKATESKPAFTWQDNSGHWYKAWVLTERDIKAGEWFYFWKKDIGIQPTFDSFTQMGWIMWLTGEPINYDQWDPQRIGWSDYTLVVVRKDK